MQAPLAHVGALQLPLLLQSKVQSEPVLQSALGQIEPPPTQLNTQVELASQVTLSAEQLPELLHSKLQVMPSLQVAVPPQVLPPSLHVKSHSAPGWQFTPVQWPEPLQLKAQVAPSLQVVPSQLLPPPLQFKVQDESVSHTTLVQ